MGHSHLIKRTALILLVIYVVTIGATFIGIILAQFRPVTLAVMALGVAIWLTVRWRRGWVWYHTPLEGAFILWALAFGLALLANQDVWRRSAIGLWYMGLYVGVWYALHDALANRRIRPDTLIDAILIAGLVVMIFGYLQVALWAAVRLPAMASGIVPIDLPRPGSMIGNPNALGTFMVVLIPFSAARLAAARNRLDRVVLGAYLALALFLVFLTYSRGAWLALGATAFVWGALLLAQHNMLSLQRLYEWWSRLRSRIRIVLIILGVTGVAAGLLVAAIFIGSFSQPGRSLGLRTLLYRPAIQLFFEKPLAGHGLFTFGRGYMRTVSIPPYQPHSHAHNAILHIATELGAPGLIALFFTLGIMARAMLRNWRSTPPAERSALAAAIAAVAGFAAHHLLDTTAMMPAIALTGLVALGLALAPTAPMPQPALWRRRSTLAGLAVLWAALLGSGVWGSAIYAQYVNILRQAVSDEDYRGAAERLLPVIEADPSLALYHLQQAFLYGMAASRGDADAAQKAIAAYRRFLEMEPYHAASWANLGALYWQLGQEAEAVAAMKRAAELAPDSWQLAFNLGDYAEAVGDGETAREVYGHVLALLPCAGYYPEWGKTALRREILSAASASCEFGSAYSAEQYVKNVLLALEDGNREEAVAALAKAQRASTGTPVEAAWLHIGNSRLAQFDGDHGTAERELQAAHEALAPGLTVADVPYGANVAYAQFLRTAIVRQFLPQVYYPTIDPELARLLDSS